MNRSSSRLVVALTVALVFSALVALRGQNGGSPRPATVAVVDVQKIVSNLAERGAIDADLVRIKEDLDRQAVEKDQALRAKAADLPVLSPDSSAYKQTEEELMKMTIEARVWREMESQKLETEKAIRMEGLYRKLIDAVARLAKKNGYDLVLYKDETEAAKGKTQQQVATIITLRKVLYSTPEMDVTDQVTQLLNNEFNNKK